MTACRSIPPTDALFPCGAPVSPLIGSRSRLPLTYRRGRPRARWTAARSSCPAVRLGLANASAPPVDIYSCALGYGGPLPRHMLWWEAVVLLRKALLALIATLITNAFMQITAVAVLMLACLILQLVAEPYARPHLNGLEAL